ncbi:MAG: hypothetical protein HY287_13185 [Planctomycetes bacterium]|nr:hypothetical protein [Planctomycetota bacterium]MBI3835276.1 hypothetical protein [Planctomycetota bacterium]
MKTALFAVALLGMASKVTIGEEFDLSWHTIDGGGAMRSTGGAFKLSGTIGQPDAGLLSGGEFSLSGGFWFPIVTGDCNQDGGIDPIELASFELCIVGPQHSMTDAGCACYDFDVDGDADLADFAILQNAFTGQ